MKLYFKVFIVVEIIGLIVYGIAYALCVLFSKYFSMSMGIIPYTSIIAGCVALTAILEPLIVNLVDDKHI
jgi:hypothetical protein